MILLSALNLCIGEMPILQDTGLDQLVSPLLTDLIISGRHFDEFSAGNRVIVRAGQDTSMGCRVFDLAMPISNVNINRDSFQIKALNLLGCAGSVMVRLETADAFTPIASIGI